MPKKIVNEKTKAIQAARKKGVPYKKSRTGPVVRVNAPPKQRKPKFGELTHDVPAIAEESKKVKETEVFAK